MFFQPYGWIVATALTACGIETHNVSIQDVGDIIVATALTACGIETATDFNLSLASFIRRCNSAYRLRY